MLIKEKYL